MVTSVTARHSFNVPHFVIVHRAVAIEVFVAVSVGTMAIVGISFVKTICVNHRSREEISTNFTEAGSIAVGFMCKQRVRRSPTS